MTFEEKVMAVLVKERTTTKHFLADTHEIVGLVEAEDAKLRAEVEELKSKVRGDVAVNYDAEWDAHCRRHQRAQEEEVMAWRKRAESADLQVSELQKIIDRARNRADKAWKLFDHNEECPVSQDTEDEERKTACECSTGEVEAILDILARTEKQKSEDGVNWNESCGA